MLAIVLVAPLALPVRAQTIWSSDADISGGDVAESLTPQNNQRSAAVDDSNNLYLLFADNRNKVGTDDNFEIYFRRFTFNFGSPNITRVTNAYNPSRFPSMAIVNWGVGDGGTAEDSGRVYMVWQDARLFSIPSVGDPKSYVIFLRTYQSRGGVGFGPEIQVSPIDSVNVATGPVIAIDRSHQAWIVWQRAVNGTGLSDLFYAVYNTQTHAVGPSIQLTNSFAFSGSPSIAATRDGLIHVVWADTRTGSTQVWWKMYAPGSGWSPDTQIVFSGVSASAPSIAADYEGRIHLVWTDGRDGNNEIYYKEYTPGLGWDALDTRLTVDPASQLQANLDVDPVGNQYVVWTDLRNGASNPDIYYKDRRGGVWSDDFPLVYNGTDNNANAVQRLAGITHDGLSTTYVVWSDERLPASSGKNREVFYKYGLANVTGAPASPAPFASRLFKTYPNPFNPMSTIRFDLERDAQVTLRAYDVQGRVVRTVVDSYLAAGPREVRWDGRDDAGRGLPSGTYFLRLRAGATVLSRAVTLLK